MTNKYASCSSRGVVLGGAGGAMVPPDFGRSVNPISTRGTDYAHLITTGTPGFLDLPTALILQLRDGGTSQKYVETCLYGGRNCPFPPDLNRVNPSVKKLLGRVSSFLLVPPSMRLNGNSIFTI